MPPNLMNKQLLPMNPPFVEDLPSHVDTAAYWQARPDPLDNTQEQEIINAQDLQSPEKGEERGFMFRRAHSFISYFCFCFY